LSKSDFFSLKKMKANMSSWSWNFLQK